jgi:FkbH-like protein
MSIDYLQHPLDVKNIILKRDQIKKDILNSGINFLEKKIAILGGSTTSELINFLDIFLLNIGIKASFYESDYGKYLEEALFDNKDLEQFNPDVIYIHTTSKNIDNFPGFSSTTDLTQSLVDEEVKKYTSIWSSLDKFNAIIIQNNFELPAYRTLGNLDAIDFRGRVNFTNQLNVLLHQEIANHKSVFLNDIHYLSSMIGLTSWHDNRLWSTYKYAASFHGLVFLAQNINKIISAAFGLNKKNLVLDLDNTLWGGVIGDDGIKKIKIGEDGSIGEAFKNFQLELKRLKDSGILLSVASKNEIENAYLGLSHPDGILKKDDFASIKANWEPKDQNIQRMAKDINLGLDSFVFIDDNPAERALVEENLPTVSVPKVGNDPNKYFEFIDKEGYFERVTLAADDLDRSRYYSENQARTNIEAKFKSQDEFLKSLEMKAKINYFDDLSLERITQLINKTNQFNLTTKRYSIKEVIKLKEDKSIFSFYGRLADRFGDNGLISVLIAKNIDNSLHIDSWLMSCRVLKRGMEYSMFNFLLEIARKNNFESIRGTYIPTKKNKMVEKLYLDLGFELISESKNENTYMIKILESTSDLDHFITVTD